LQRWLGDRNDPRSTPSLVRGRAPRRLRGSTAPTSPSPWGCSRSYGFQRFAVKARARPARALPGTIPTPTGSHPRAARLLAAIAPALGAAVIAWGDLCGLALRPARRSALASARARVRSRHSARRIAEHHHRPGVSMATATFTTASPVSASARARTFGLADRPCFLR
jgi:hypothetical protein